MTVKEINIVLSAVIDSINQANECNRVILNYVKGNADVAHDIRERCEIRYEHLISVANMCGLKIIPRYCNDAMCNTIDIEYHDTRKQLKANKVFRFTL